MADAPPTFIAFDGKTCIARGPLPDVALRIQAAQAANPHAQVLVLDASSSELIDFDHRGTPAEMLDKLAGAHPGLMGDGPAATAPKAGPGRPRLGVVAREVTLLPRHWDWLGSQPGGASVALRKLVDQARRDNQTQDSVRQAQEASYRFMVALAGELDGFEEASRALFAGQQARFAELLQPWPQDVRTHLLQLAAPAFTAATVEAPRHA